MSKIIYGVKSATTQNLLTFSNLTTNYLQRTAYTTDSGAITVPAGANYAFIKLWGQGGLNSLAVGSVGGDNGGAGGTIYLYFAVNPGDAYYIYMNGTTAGPYGGTGGTGGGSAGGNGGAATTLTMFSNSTHIMYACSSGGGGGGGVSSNFGSLSAGGSGGYPTGSNGGAGGGTSGTGGTGGTTQTTIQTSVSSSPIWSPTGNGGNGTTSGSGGGGGGGGGYLGGTGGTGSAGNGSGGTGGGGASYMNTSQITIFTAYANGGITATPQGFSGDSDYTFVLANNYGRANFNGYAVVYFYSTLANVPGVQSANNYALPASTTGLNNIFASALYNQPTLSSTAAQTTTTASTVTIVGPPVAGTNQTITTSNAFRTLSGNSVFGTITGAISLTPNTLSESGISGTWIRNDGVNTVFSNTVGSMLYGYVSTVGNQHSLAHTFYGGNTTATGAISLTPNTSSETGISGAWIRNDGVNTVFSNTVGSMLYGYVSTVGNQHSLAHTFYGGSTTAIATFGSAGSVFGTTTGAIYLTPNTASETGISGTWIRNDGVNTVFSTTIGSIQYGFISNIGNQHSLVHTFYGGNTTPILSTGNLGSGAYTALNEYPLLIRAGTDRNHYLMYGGSTGFNVDGPLLAGYSGGMLASTNSGTFNLSWTSGGNVVVNNSLSVTVGGSTSATNTVGSSTATLSVCNKIIYDRILRFQTDGNLVIYNGTGSSLFSTGTTNSDRRYKENIYPVENALEMVSKMEGIYFNYTKEHDPYDWKRQRVGVIAQDIDVILPQCVRKLPTNISDEVSYLVDLDRIVPVLIESIKELKLQVEQMKAEIVNLSN